MQSHIVLADHLACSRRRMRLIALTWNDGPVERMWCGHVVMSRGKEGSRHAGDTLCKHLEAVEGDLDKKMLI